MKKNVIGLAIVGSLVLSACGGGGGGGDDTPEPIAPNNPGSVPRTKAIFESSDANCDGYAVPTPNDLLFSGSTDLTINIPAPSAACANAPAYSAAKRAIQEQISRLDGWSTTAPFIIKFGNTDSSIKIDPATISGGTTLKVFKVTLQRSEIAPGIIAPTGAVTGVQSELTAGTDYRVEIAGEDSTGMTVRVLPLKPLSPQSSYMVVLTNGIKDTRGNVAIADSAYGVAKQLEPLPSDNPARALQALVNAQEAAAAGTGIARDSIILSYVFTTQSVNEVLATTRAFINSPAINPTSAFQLIAPQNLLPAPANAAPGAANTLIYGGQLTVPYFLTATSATPNPATGTITDTTPINSFWKAPATLSNGSPNPLGTNLSYANKLPAATGTETIPVLLSVPSPALTQCAKPYPVVIFQHGITRNRTDMFGISATFANQCVATVAIDQPMHGLPSSNGLFQGYSTTDANGPLRERTFGLDLMNNSTGALGSPDGVPDSSGSWFINLQTLLNTRDNLRQAVADLFTVTKAIGSMDYDGGGADFDSEKIYFVGQSLGSVVGSTFVAYETKVKAAVLSVPGGGLSRLLDGSASFGPRIRGGLAANGVVAGTSDYESFLFAAQTVVDSGDPINTAAVQAARGVPVLVHEVIGGANGSPSDLVIPNQVVAGTITAVNPSTNQLNLPYTVFTSGPLGGTEPLISALGLSSISSTTGPSATGIRGAVRFVAGAHGSLLAPDANLDPSGTVTAEMQTQAVSFIKSNGAFVQVVNGNILRP